MCFINTRSDRLHATKEARHVAITGKHEMLRYFNKRFGKWVYLIQAYNKIISVCD
jgi:hypothetical protein